MVPHWRQMTAGDLPAIMVVQAEGYPFHQEDQRVFLNRMARFPEGCLVLDEGSGVSGYILSHPWFADAPPALDSEIGPIPEEPGTYYLHDLALLKSVNGKGHGARVVRHLADTAGAGLATMSLVAVNQSQPFWERHGFTARTTPALAEKLKTYGGGAAFMTRPLPLG